MLWALKQLLSGIKRKGKMCLDLALTAQDPTKIKRSNSRNFDLFNSPRMGLKTMNGGFMTSRKGPGPGTYSSQTIFERI
jgi:hypothetical protein